MGNSLPDMLAEARRVQEALSAWDGGVCKVEQYHGGTHPILRLWLYHKAKPHSLAVLCGVPLRMSGPFGWSGCALRVVAEEYMRPNWPGPVNVFVLSDGTVDFRIICCHVELRDAGPAPHWVRQDEKAL
jgi:hypothetical protein